MFQLIYVSTAVRRFREEELHALADRARTNNDRLGITGVLVYRNGSFLHVLEGEDEDTVRQLYDTIRQDDRHKWVTLLKASSLDERDFPGQPLLFRDRSVASERQHPLSNGEADARSDGTGAAHETLLQFQRAETRSAPPTPAPSKKEAAEEDASASASASEAAAS